jgi:hypothetical protein
MARIQPRFGFPLKRGYEFRLHGQWYFVGKASMRTLKLLAAIYGTWAPLREMAEHDPDPRIRRMAAAQPARPHRQRLAECMQRVSRVSTATGAIC